MKRLSRLFILFLLITWSIFQLKAVLPTLALDPVEELQQQINELEKLRQLSIDATTPLQSELDNLESRIQSARNGIVSAQNKASQLEKDIEKREEDMAVQYQILAIRIGEEYKRSRTLSPLMTFLTTQDASQLTKDLAYRSSVKAKDNQLIEKIIADITQLEADKEQLEKDQITLASLEKQLDEQAEFFRVEIDKAKDYQGQLSGQIAALSAQQQAILSARSGSFITSVGSVPLSSDYNSSIGGFNDNAPGGYFGVFSFGAYTHRKGMSQYGAKARANNGQGANEILQAYYGKSPANKDTSGTISVSGYGNLEFDGYYLYGIAEMPSDWPLEALKAQAIAARSYAYRYKVDGSTICTTESCQVFSQSKANNPPGAWKQAVDETKGQILEDVVTYYSSTSGGYLTTKGWDTTDGSGSGDWTTRAWESIAGSPWFYKSWYRQSYSNSSNNCGRNPWMSPEEMSDILNAWLVLKQGQGNGADTGRVVPITINSCPIGGQSGNPYSMDELKSKTNNPVTSINGDPVVNHDNNGNTSSVKFSTNRGDLTIPGSEFKEVFNTRAPGYISIPQSGFSFFNIERK